MARSRSPKSLTIQISLPSGRSFSTTAALTAKVEALAVAAENAFESSFLSLQLLHQGERLDRSESLEDAGLRHEDWLTAVVILPLVAASAAAFASLRGGSVVTWGNPECGGDSSKVQARLRHVREIQSSYGAFAAILADQSVVTWGNPDYGGDSSKVQDQLRNVQQIQATDHAFAALLADGTVVTWGSSDCGGDARNVNLRHVQQIQSSSRAFAAILATGSVVTWGDKDFGGDSQSSRSVDKREEGPVISWGLRSYSSR